MYGAVEVVREMPRVKEFDPELALARAMELFWQQGYEGTSLKQLLEVMGIRRQSLYDTYGDKHSLYLAVLERYRELIMTLVDDHLAREDASLSAVHGFCQHYLSAVMRTDKRACLMASAALELGLRDEEVATKVRNYLSALELALRRVLERAMQAGALRADANPVAMARHLVNSLMGLSVMGRGAGLSRPAMRQLVTTALAVLE